MGVQPPGLAGLVLRLPRSTRLPSFGKLLELSPIPHDVGVLASRQLQLVHGLPLSARRPRVGIVHLVSPHRRFVGVPAPAVEIVRLVPPRPVPALRSVVRLLPQPFALMAERALQPSAHPRRRAQLSQLRVRQVPSQRLRVGDLCEVP